MTRLRADFLLLFAAAIWGLAFVYQKTAMTSVGPLTFIAARAIVATLALLPLAVIEHSRAGVPTRKLHQPSQTFGVLQAGLLAGLAFFIAAALQQFGLRTATATNGGFLTALYVVFTPPLAFLLRRASPGPAIIPAALLSALGTWMLGGSAFAALSTGDWLIAACAIFWALHVILAELGAAFDRPVVFTCVQFATVGIAASIGASIFESVSLAALIAARTEILYVGILSSAGTFTILTLALRYAPASEAAIIISTESLFAALAGSILLGERLSPIAWLGAALIMAAVLLVQLAPRRPSSQPA